MTGTPLDLTPFGGLLAALGWLYWVLAMALIVFALWLPRKPWLKLMLAASVACAVIYPLFVRPVQQHVAGREQAQVEYRLRLAEATALFEARCRSAGETRKRIVEGVDGVVWMKWRAKRGPGHYRDQFSITEPYGTDCSEEECIDQLLKLENQGNRFVQEAARRKNRYRFVETTDPADGLKYRYVGSMSVSPSWTAAGIEAHRKQTGQDVPDYSYLFKSRRERIDRFSARYGITWDDISTREDREHWIAGGALRVVDLQGNEVIAERIGYMMDRGLGDESGSRQPWGYAEQDACPQFPQIGAHDPRRRRTYNESSDFVTSVLRPSGNEK
jgi:hypothetical protein